MSNPSAKSLNILIVDGTDVPHPEDAAMLSALYSRSHASVTDHIEKVKKSGSGKFMEQYYVGYGHNSIADMGDTTIYIENISMLAAKAIEDCPIGNYQECSTRYIDFSVQPFLGPLAESHPEAHAILMDGWRKLYFNAIQELVVPIREHYTIDMVVPDNTPENKRESVYTNTIKAIIFDIARSLLPCGAATSVAWKTSLRKLNEHTEWLEQHPLAEVREIGKRIRESAVLRYPHSIRKKPRNENIGNTYDYYYDTRRHDAHIARINEEPLLHNVSRIIQGVLLKNRIDFEGFERKKYTALPKEMANSFLFILQGSLDFGSFRDLQRHRNGYVAMPLVDESIGFNSWYADWLTQVESIDLLGLMHNLVAATLDSSVSTLDRQYYLPMGMTVPVEMHWTLGQLVYVLELRSGKTVHPTLRKMLEPLPAQLNMFVPGIKNHIFIDVEPNYLQSKRGLQDIVEKR